MRTPLFDSPIRIPHEGRGGFTLLEVLLAMSIGVLLLGALYVAVDVQLRSAQIGRDLVEQSKLARSLLTHMGSDMINTINLPNASRFRNPSSGSASAATTQTTTASTTTSSTTEASATESTTGGIATAVTIPFGIQGDAEVIHLYLSKSLSPSEAFVPIGSEPPPPVSDLRRISYWLAPGGLAKQEVRIITSQDVANLLPPDLPEDAYRILAEEARSLVFSYFDGTTWQDSWDSTTPGTDGVTPIGPPRAVAIVIGLARPGARDNAELAYHRHVVAITTANGTTISSNGTVTDTGVVGGITTGSMGSTTGSMNQ